MFPPHDDVSNGPHFGLYDFVFAKVQTWPPWPAIVMPSVSVEEVPLPKKSDDPEDYRWVYFLMSENYSWVKQSALKPYEAFRDKYVSIHKKADFKEAVAMMDIHLQLRRLNPSYVVENIVEFKGGSVKKKPADRPKSRLNNHANEPKVGRPKSRLSNPENETKVGRPRSRLNNHVNGQRPNSKLANNMMVDMEKSVERPKSRANSRIENHNNAGRKTPSENEKKTNKRRRPSSAVSSGYHSADFWDAKKRRQSIEVDYSDDDGDFMGRCAPCMPHPPQFIMLDTSRVKITDKRIGVLGLGFIGRHVAGHLVRSGHRVNVWNRSPAKRKQLEAELRPAVGKNLFGFANLRELLRKSDILLVCVAGYEHCKEFVQENFGVHKTENRILEGKSVVVMSHIDPVSSMDIRNMVHNKGASYLEAQFQWGNIDGKLILFTAGDKQLFEDCQSCFKVVSAVSLYFGKTGDASLVTLLFQLVRGAIVAGLSEGIRLARLMDFSESVATEFLPIAGFNSQFLMQKLSKIVANDFKRVDQSLEEMHRDMSKGLMIMENWRCKTDVLTAANRLFRECRMAGMGEMDCSALYMMGFE